MKLSGKMYFMIILKFTINQGFTLCLDNTIFKKPQGGGGGQTDPAPAVLGLKHDPASHSFNYCFILSLHFVGCACSLTENVNLNFLISVTGTQLK